jgi:hypothetical protein
MNPKIVESIQQAEAATLSTLSVGGQAYVDQRAAGIAARFAELDVDLADPDTLNAIAATVLILGAEIMAHRSTMVAACGHILKLAYDRHVEQTRGDE